MKILINIVSFIAGLTVIFGIYSGKFLWVLIGLIPLLFIVGVTFFKKRRIIADVDSVISKEIEQLKRSGEKISLNFDNCEFKDSSYSQNIIDERMTRFSHINLDYGKVIGQENVGQSLLVYNYSGSNGTEKFMQAFPYGKESLQVSVIRNQVTLYVDRYDRRKYFFDLKTD